MARTPGGTIHTPHLLPGASLAGSGSRRIHPAYEYFRQRDCFRNELAGNSVVEWLVRFHENLLIGTTGRLVHGVGGGSLVLLCLTGAVIWWPGIKHWRRSLGVDWSGHVARITWDVHSALGFWFFLFVLLWGMSGIYFAFPEAFNFLLALDPADRFTDSAPEGTPGPVTEQSAETYAATFDTNVLGTL